jgi:hypothetical protein
LRPRPRHREDRATSRTSRKARCADARGAAANAGTLRYR